MENNKTPSIRFKGFTDPWEQRKVSEVSEIVAGGTPSTSVSEYWEPKEVPWLSSGEVHKKYITYTDDMISKNGLANSSAKIIKKNSVLIALAGQGKTRGTVAINRISLSTNQSIAAMSFNDDIVPEFVFSNLENRYDEIRAMSSGDGSRGGLNKQLVGDITIPYTIKEEQQKIGQYFSNLDHLITLHQRKYNKLLNVKKSMLEKMFPKNGSNIPEIRFKGFTDPWEQRKLGELADIVGGGTPSTGVSDYWDGDIDWYAPAEIAEQIYLTSSQRKITEEGYNHSSAKMLPVGTVLFTSRAGIGKTAILTQKGCTNQGFQSIVPHKIELDSYFIFSRTEELKQYGETVGAGSTFVEVSGKQMANMELMMPKTMAEQKTIGQYFASLDNLITLHQRELEKLQNIKKSMLEKMFV